MKINKLAMCYGPLDLRVEEKPIEDPLPGEIQIEIKSALTCGTDVKIYKRGYPFLKPPFPIGHEYSGVITAVGKGLDPSLIGKRAVTSNGAGCHFCFYCIRGTDNLCEKMESEFDQYAQMGGGFARYINVHAPIVKANLKTFSEDVSFEQAAMVEPVSVALHGINQTDIKIGDTLAIIGAGPMGLLFVQLAKMRGARVITIEKNEMRLEKAGEFGADVLINPTTEDDVVRIVHNKANGGRGPDRVIEAVGLPETWEMAISMARKGGTVVEYGGCPSGTKITVDTQRLHYDELTIKGSYSATAYETEMAFELLARRMIKAEDYISGTYALDRTKDALDAHANQKGIKFEILPG